MRRFLAFLLLVAAVPLDAAAADDDLRRLAGTLQQELGNATLDDATRAEIRALLLRSLELAKVSAGRRPPDADCMAVATPVYEKQYQASSALEMSAKLCADPVDADVLDLAYAVYSKGLQPVSALSEAVGFARRRDLEGKAALIEFSYARLTKQFQPVSAFGEAVKLAAPAPRNAEQCVAKAFETYAKQFQAFDALKRAFGTCGG